MCHCRDAPGPAHRASADMANVQIFLWVTLSPWLGGQTWPGPCSRASAQSALCTQLLSTDVAPTEQFLPDRGFPWSSPAQCLGHSAWDTVPGTPADQTHQRKHHTRQNSIPIFGQIHWSSRYFFPNLKLKLLLLSPFHLPHSQSGHVLIWEELTWPTARVPRKVSAGAGGEGREQKKSMPGCEVFRGGICSPSSPGLS